jgi:glycosyltransferase involved in cell wall biosynthesis
VKAALYNRHWPSAGGGERHAGMIAQVLAEDGVDVTLLGHDFVRLDRLGRYLGLDLSGCSYVRLPDKGGDSVPKCSEDFDLFINSTYMSRLAPRARRNVYLCFFPTPCDHDLGRWRKAAARVLRPMMRPRRATLDYGRGWYPPEGGLRRRWAWTNGEGILRLAPGGPLPLRMLIGRPGAANGVSVSVETDDGVLATIAVSQQFQQQTVQVPARTEETDLRLVSDAFVPGGTDMRALGVAVSRLRVGSSTQALTDRLGMRFPWLLVDPRDLAYLDAYDLVLANSAFTREWIRRLWQRESEILYPPTAIGEPRPAGERDKIILLVGRFFSPGFGHSKRQLEMVRWFGELVRSGRLPGWTMHVVGGCEVTQLPYLRSVQAAAQGLPVVVEANVRREQVRRLYSTASIFWSATGYGEDESVQPWASEHFGMTTVEAMSGGCVPIVIDRAGGREIVRHLVDGIRWNSPRELLDYTELVSRDEGLRSRLAHSAMQRAYDFSDEAFAASWRKLAAQYGLTR